MTSTPSWHINGMSSGWSPLLSGPRYRWRRCSLCYDLRSLTQGGRVHHAVRHYAEVPPHRAKIIAHRRQENRRLTRQTGCLAARPLETQVEREEQMAKQSLSGQSPRHVGTIGHIDHGKTPLTAATPGVFQT